MPDIKSLDYIYNLFYFVTDRVDEEGQHKDQLLSQNVRDIEMKEKLLRQADVWLDTNANETQAATMARVTYCAVLEVMAESYKNHPEYADIWEEPITRERHGGN